MKLPLAGCVSMLWGILKELAVTVLEASTIPVTSNRTSALWNFNGMAAVEALTVMPVAVAFITTLFAVGVRILPDRVPLA